MKLSVNGEIMEANFATLSDWVGKKGVAIAVNDNIVPSSKWASFALQDGDRILVVAATQGG